MRDPVNNKPRDVAAVWLSKAAATRLIRVHRLWCSFSSFALGLRALESPSSVTDRNLERIASLLAVPTIRTHTLALTKQSKVGMDRMSYQTPRSGWSSTLTFATFTVPAHALATSSSTDSITWQGRLHGAENATITGCSDLRTSGSKFPSPISMIGNLCGFVFISSAAVQIHKPGVLRCSSANVAGVAGRIGQAVRTNSLLPNQPAGFPDPWRR